MRLYPLGNQRDLDTDFDNSDFYGLNWAEGRVKPHVFENRRYSGLYIERGTPTLEVYYYEFCTVLDAFEKERIYEQGYKRTDIQCGKCQPLYVCVDTYVLHGGTYVHIQHDKELLPSWVAKRLLKDYLDPYYYKPNQAIRKQFNKDKGVVT